MSTGAATNAAPSTKNTAATKAAPGADLIVNTQGALPLPWMANALADALQNQQGHALLVHASPGAGALAFGMVLAQSRLCEAQADASAPLRPACGHCSSCRLFHARVHPDLMVLMPQTLREQHAWPLSGDKVEGEDAKKKPSKQIRIDEVRAMLEWAGKTSARGRGKAVLLHPAEALNLQSANALLKTLEEPAPGTRLILTASDPARLLPTLRSRCQLVRLPLPSTQDSSAWLAGQGVDMAEQLLAAASGLPLLALEMASNGIDAQAWARLPRAVQHGQPGCFTGWPVPRVLDALQKLCHDAMAMAAGGQPRFFPANAMPVPPSGNRAQPGKLGRAVPHAEQGTPQTRALTALGKWSKDLARVSRHAEHTWNEPLLIESLVTSGARAMSSWS